MNFHETTNVIVIDGEQVRILKPGVLLADFREYLRINDALEGSDEKDWGDMIATDWMHDMYGTVLLVNTNGAVRQL